jgi:hypothetical protein
MLTQARKTNRNIEGRTTGMHTKPDCFSLLINRDEINQDFSHAGEKMSHRTMC